ncbi:hypothetical protein RFI_09096 [Reticulomyxa filosa]|uniref:Uncharacterized protein n=1 Tax=Reticulomyxa filosa TaxID=46433 RepID=X6NQQ6_RETFI|nr:hypothetical protein RFI_09096 [Reticulomyxa filosa]|eukprot:ETO28034.1 hypothetical protein RFI_09096 [Reticulomyxa filosa]
MIALNGGNEEGQDVLYPLYWIAVSLLGLFLVLHIVFWLVDKPTRDIEDNDGPFRNVVCCPYLREATYNTFLKIITALALATAIAALTVEVLSYHQLTTTYSLNCRRQWATIVCYCIHKFFIYECLTFRLQAAFSTSAYVYNRLIIVSLHTLNIAYLSLGVPLPVMTGRTHLEGIAKDGAHICSLHYPIWGALMIAIFDMAVNLLLLSLFVKPLIVIAKQQHQYIIENDFVAMERPENTGGVIMHVYISEELSSNPQPQPPSHRAVPSKEKDIATKQFAENSILYKLLVRYGPLYHFVLERRRDC